MELNTLIIVISLIICGLINAYCCAFVHVERYITLHEPLLAVPLYSGLATKMGLGMPALLFWIIPTIVASIITTNIFVGISYFVLAQLLAPTGLMTVHRFKKRIVEPNKKSKDPLKKERKEFYEWIIKRPSIIMDYSTKSLDPFLAYMESAHPDDLNKKIKL